MAGSKQEAYCTVGYRWAFVYGQLTYYVSAAYER